MRRFAALYRELDRSTATGDKRAALVAYFRDAPPADAAWALHLLSGGKISGAGRKIAQLEDGMKGQIADGMRVRVSIIEPQDMAAQYELQRTSLAELYAAMSTAVCDRCFGRWRECCGW